MRSIGYSSRELWSDAVDESTRTHWSVGCGYAAVTESARKYRGVGLPSRARQLLRVSVGRIVRMALSATLVCLGIGRRSDLAGRVFRYRSKPAEF